MEDALVFLVEDTTPGRLAELRKCLMRSVACVAAGRVVVDANDSLLCDEVVARRIAETPLLHALVEGYAVDATPADVDPMRASDEERPLHIECVVPEDTGTTVATAASIRLDGRCVAAVSTIPLTLLPSGGRLVARAACVRGRGELHARFRPVSVVTFKPEMSLTLHTQPPDAARFVAEGPPGCFCVDTDGNVCRTKKRLFGAYDGATAEWKRFLEPESDRAPSYEVTVESVGQRPAVDLVTEAKAHVNIAEGKVDLVEERTLLCLDDGRCVVLVSERDHELTVRDITGGAQFNVDKAQVTPL